MESELSWKQLLLERLEERKICLQSKILKYLEENSSVENYLSPIAKHIIRRVKGDETLPSTEPISSCCIPSESLVFSSNLFEEDLITWNREHSFRTLKVVQVKLLSNRLFVLGDGWLSLWDWNKSEMAVPLCKLFKWLDADIVPCNGIISPDQQYIVIQGLDISAQDEGYNEESLNERRVHNYLFELESLKFIRSFDSTLPCHHPSEHNSSQVSVLVVTEQAKTNASSKHAKAHLFTVGYDRALYRCSVDTVTESVEWFQLSANNEVLKNIGTLFLDQGNWNTFETAVYGQFVYDKIAIWKIQDEEPILVLNLSHSSSMLLPFRLFNCSTELLLLQQEKEIDKGDGDLMTQSCWILGYICLIRDDCEFFYKLECWMMGVNGCELVDTLSLDFIGDDRVIDCYLSADNKEPLLFIICSSGKIVFVDIASCSVIANIQNMKVHSKEGMPLTCDTFENRAAVVWKDMPSVVHLWHRLDFKG